MQHAAYSMNVSYTTLCRDLFDNPTGNIAQTFDNNQIFFQHPIYISFVMNILVYEQALSGMGVGVGTEQGRRGLSFSLPLSTPQPHP